MNTEKSILIDLINGLEGSLKDLNAKRDIFIKAKGLNEQTEKLRDEASRVRFQIENAKQDLKELMDEKTRVMMTVTSGMARRMNDVLPYGSAIVEISEDGALFIGWFTKTAKIPYSGLSGGEKAAFDPALCRALGGSILCIEAAEIDDEHLDELLGKYAESGLQCIVSTCHAPNEIPGNGWEGVFVG